MQTPKITTNSPMFNTTLTTASQKARKDAQEDRTLTRVSAFAGLITVAGAGVMIAGSAGILTPLLLYPAIPALAGISQLRRAQSEKFSSSMALLDTISASDPVFSGVFMPQNIIDHLVLNRFAKSTGRGASICEINGLQQSLQSCLYFSSLHADRQTQIVAYLRFTYQTAPMVRVIVDLETKLASAIKTKDKLKTAQLSKTLGEFKISLETQLAALEGKVAHAEVADLISFDDV